MTWLNRRQIPVAAHRRSMQRSRVQKQQTCLKVLSDKRACKFFVTEPVLHLQVLQQRGAIIFSVCIYTSVAGAHLSGQREGSERQ